jgi:hypothetical protein
VEAATCGEEGAGEGCTEGVAGAGVAEDGATEGGGGAGVAGTGAGSDGGHAGASGARCAINGGRAGVGEESDGEASSVPSRRSRAIRSHHKSGDHDDHFGHGVLQDYDHSI